MLLVYSLGLGIPFLLSAVLIGYLKSTFDWIKSHYRIINLVSGGLLVLGLLFPHTQGEDRDGKRQIYGLAKQFRQRFFETFGHTRCGDLLRARCGVSEKTTAAARLGLTAHCDIMVVTAVELLEALLREAA